MIYLFMLSALLLPAQRQAPLRRPPEMAVPQGWTVALSGFDLVVNHSSGASLRVVHRRTTDDLQAFAEREADGVASPLGFAHIGIPVHSSDGREEWFQYEIRGNRIAEHRRILFRAIRNSDDPNVIIEITYENSEARFDVLLTEAQSVATQFLSR